MTVQTPPTNPVITPDPDPADALTVVQVQSNALVEPALIADDITARLDRLFDDGADPQVIQALADQTADLVDMSDALQGYLRTAIESARALRDQREQARQQLADLKTAMEDVNVSVPEIEALYASVEEMMLDWVWELSDENLREDIMANTGLTYPEAVKLLDILRGDGPSPDSPLWNELREWINFAQQEYMQQ